MNKKKTIKTIMSLVLSIGLLTSTGIVSFAGINSQELTGITSISKYRDAVEVYNLSQRELDTFSSQDLLQSVMDYPLLVKLYLQDDFHEALNSIGEEFNAVEKLLSHTDAGEVILREYERISIPKDSETSMTVLNRIAQLSGEALDGYLKEALANPEISKSLQEDFQSRATLDLLETLLVKEDVVKTFDSITKKRCDNALVRKQAEKMKTVLFEGNQKGIINTMRYSGTEGAYEDCIRRINAMDTKANTYVKTPKGSSVIVYTLKYWGVATSASVTAQFKRAFPVTTVLANADNRYNCHSYAWYKASSTTNTYWMDNPGKYMSDGSYIKAGTTPTATGQKITWRRDAMPYREYTHSGIISSLNGSNPMVKSKLGQGPLVKDHASMTAVIGGYEGIKVYYRKAN